MGAIGQFLHSIPLDLIIIQTVNGIVAGMILALVASGLTLIFGILDVVNFAHGELFMLGAYVGVLIVASTGNFWLGLVGAALIVAIIGAALQIVTLRPLIGRDPLNTILATFRDFAGSTKLRALAIRPDGAPHPGADVGPFHVVLPGISLVSHRDRGTVGGDHRRFLAVS